MNEENKISKKLSQINRYTKERGIFWETLIHYPNLGLSSNEELVGKIYQTEFEGRKLRLFKINRKVQTDEFEFNWIPAFKLEILDHNDSSDWEFPDHRGIWDLYDSVRYQVSNIDSFLSSGIDEDDNK